MVLGDVLNISITDIDDIDGSYTISPDGDVTIPYVGQVLINDKTKEEAQALVNNGCFCVGEGAEYYC